MSNLAALVAQTMLHIGMQGDAVRELQLALASLGYKLKGTGYFGGATDAAVSDFQRVHGLKADGVVGPKTATAIDLATSGLVTVPSVSKEETARPLWLIYGLTLVNIKEEPGSRDNLQILEWARAEGGSIARDYKRDSIPWCSLYTNHIFTKVGLKGTETLWALDWGTDKWPSIELAGPCVGSVAAMTRPGGGHVITLVGRDQSGNIMGLSGNQKDEVSVRPFPPSRLDQGFRWPADVPAPSQIGFASLPLVRSDGRISTNEA